MVVDQTLQDQDSTHGHHQMVNTEIRLVIFFAAKDGEALHSQQKQDQELEVRNRLKDLDLIDRVPDKLCNEVRDIVQETEIKTLPMEKKCKISKMAVWGGLTHSCEKKRSKKQGRKGKTHPFECRVPKNSKER